MMTTLRTCFTWSLILLLLAAGVCRVVCTVPSTQRSVVVASMPCCAHPDQHAATPMSAAHPDIIAAFPFLAWPPLALALITLLLTTPVSVRVIPDVLLCAGAPPPYLRTRRLRL